MMDGGAVLIYGVGAEGKTGRRESMKNERSGKAQGGIKQSRFDLGLGKQVQVEHGKHMFSRN